MNAMVAVAVVCSAATACAQTLENSARRAVDQMLQEHMGVRWAPGPGEFDRWSCPEGRATAPSGKRLRYNWLCERPDPSFRRLLLWRVGPVETAAIEEDHFNGMAGGKDAPRGEPRCEDVAWSHPSGSPAGTLRDCSLPLPNGVFHASFAHLAHQGRYFTLSVRNASPKGSSPRVATDLRQWLSQLEPESKTPP